MASGWPPSVYLSLYTLKAHRAQSPNCRNQTAVQTITFHGQALHLRRRQAAPGPPGPGPLVDEGYSPCSSGACALLRFVQRPLLPPEVLIGRRPTASRIGNAILRKGPRGARLAKERKDSTRLDRRCCPRRHGPRPAAALASAVRDSIYL
jgi:hypothetical protein